MDQLHRRWLAGLRFGGSPHRAQKLKLAVDLEGKLRVMSRAAPRHTAKVRRAAVRADELFDELGRTLGNDLADIFDQAASIPDQAVRLQ